MFATKISTHLTTRLSQLGVTAFICWSLGTNTHVDAANTLNAAYAASPGHEIASGMLTKDVARNLQVLSPKDAELYRAAFAAQAKGDWKAADLAIANLKDRRLLGHVLADRYERRPATAVELREWLVSYSSLPEADDIFDTAQKLPAVTGTKLVKPTLTDAWTGSNSYGTSSGFKAAANDNSSSKGGHRFAIKISHAIKEGDVEDANQLVETEQKRGSLSSNEIAENKAHIAAGFFYQGEIDNARKVAEEAVAQNLNPLALWIDGLASWKQNDMEAASNAFAKLATVQGLSSWDHSAAAFWAYRALKRSGQTALANYWLKDAAQQPHSFYGLMAAHLLSHDTSGSWQMPELNAQNIAILSRHPAGWRALALVQVGQASLAESELGHLNPQGQRNLQAAMLALAEVGHLPSVALQLGGLATNDNGKLYDAALYPVPPWQPQEGFKVDRALIYALIRHESQFDPLAVSDRGACGLMQLMPATANLMTDDVIGRGCSAQLLNPSYNIALGQKYVRHLAEQPIIGNNLLLLLAAYNSGPSKLSHWIDEDTRHDPLLFIESLPVRETRDYVQQVLTHYWMYRSRLNESMTSLTQLSHGEWPRVSLRDETLPSKNLEEVENISGFAVASSK